MSQILQEIIQAGRLCFAERAENWREAIQMGCQPLIQDGSVALYYPEQIIRSLEEYGPYIAFEHQVAMPHTQMMSHSVRHTAVSLMILKEPVAFEAEGNAAPKTARLFFTLAASDPEAHLNNIRQLVEVFQNYPLLDALMAAETPEQVAEAEIKYLAADDSDVFYQ